MLRIRAEGRQEQYAYLLEVRTNGGDFMYEILNGEDIILGERLLDDRVAA